MLLWALLACDPGGRGDRAWEAGDIDGAISGYRREQALSDVQRARYARALIQVGEPEQAAEVFKMVVQFGPDARVAQTLLEPNPATALEYALLGLEEHGEAALFLPACTLALQIGDGRAMENCTQASLVLPLDPVPRLAVAELSLRQGLLPTAREYLDSVGALDLSRDERLWLLSLWEQAGEPKEACSAGRQLGEDLYPVAAACLSAQHPDGEAMLGRLEGPRAGALRLRLAVGRAQAAGPGPERARQIAIAHAGLREAEALSETAPVLTDAARLAVLEGELDQARSLLTQAMAVQPPELAPWLNMARLSAREGDLERALQTLASAPEFGPTEALALELERLQLTQAMGRLVEQDALDLLQRCTELGQSRCVGEVHYVLAVQRSAETATAAGHLDQAVTYGGPALGGRALSEPALVSVLRSSELMAWDRDPTLSEIRAQALKIPSR